MGGVQGDFDWAATRRGGGRDAGTETVMITPDFNHASGALSLECRYGASSCTAAAHPQVWCWRKEMWRRSRGKDCSKSVHIFGGKLLNFFLLRGVPYGVYRNYVSNLAALFLFFVHSHFLQKQPSLWSLTPPSHPFPPEPPTSLLPSSPAPHLLPTPSYYASRMFASR